jgi:NADH-quinone oxidoreductase subunit D
VVQLDDDCITDLEVEIGRSHRGFEKEAESASWDGTRPFVSRLGYASGLMAEVAYCLAVEALAGTVLPDRAIWLRMFGMELSRATDHFARLAGTMAALGLRDAEVAAQQGELAAARLLARATGRSPLAGWSCLGGVESDLPGRFENLWTEAMPVLAAHVDRVTDAAVDNPTGQRRLRDVATLSATDALAWSVTGPALRASGVGQDVRKDRPYLAYDAVDFDVPVGETGDAFDRLLVVVEEIRQSLAIADQCHERLASLGPGRIQAEGGAEAREGWSEIESSTGALGFLLFSEDQGTPRRVRCRAPSFFHAQALPAMLRGERLDDLLPTAALLHLIAGECDR